MIDLIPITPALTKLQAIEKELDSELIERSDVIRAVLLALLTRQHAVILGPPGAAKSMLITLLADRIRENGISSTGCVKPSANGNGAAESDTAGDTSCTPNKGLKTFIWLFTKLTQPDEIFGPVSITGLKNDEFRRVTSNKLPEAELVFADEIFKSGSAILNSLLTVMNERVFDNGSQRQSCPLISLFAASNEMPQGEDLSALWDRLVIRIIVEYTSDRGFSRLVRVPAQKNQTTRISKQELLDLQTTVKQIPVPNTVYDAIEKFRKDLSAKGITVSDRRWLWSMDLLRAQALLENRGIVEEEDLMVLKDALWTEPDQRADIGRLAAKLSNPLNAQALEIEDAAQSAFTLAQEASGANPEDDEIPHAAMEAFGKFKSSLKKLEALKQQAIEQSRSPAKINSAISKIEAFKSEIANGIGLL